MSSLTERTNQMNPVNQVYAVIAGDAWDGERFQTLKLFSVEKDALRYADQLRDMDNYEYAYVKLMDIN